MMRFLGAQAPLQLVYVKKKKRGQKVSKYQLLALSCKLFQECIKVCKYASITARNGNLSSRGWSPTNKRMVTQQKDENYRLGIWHLHFTCKTNNR